MRLPVLKLDFCSHRAAKYAVQRWHYSKTMPTPPLVDIGVWESGVFVGVVVFGRGNCPHYHCEWGLQQNEVCELCRVALCAHATPTTKIVSIALGMLSRQSPELKMVVSFADVDQGHAGIIYRAGNWLYLGWTKGGDRFRDSGGRMWHSRMLSPTGVKKVYGKWRRVLRPQDLERVATKGRHKFVYPLSKQMRHKLCAGSVASDVPAIQAGEGGATPTPALTNCEAHRA